MAKFNWVFQGKVINVVDGDTVDVLIDQGFHHFQKIRFRIRGMDAPEVRGKDKGAGNESKRIANFLLLGKDVTVKTEKHGKYRWLCDLTMPNGNDFATHMIEIGKAFKIPR